MEPAQAADRQDRAFAQPPLRFRNRRRQLRSAFRARVGLRMKSPIARIVIFRLASRAHAESRHGGIRPVVRNVADDSVARAAIRTVGERIAIAPVGRIGEIVVAVGAGSHVRRYQDEFARLRPAFANCEIQIPQRIDLRYQHLFNARQRRRFGAHALDETIQRIARAFHLRHHSGRRVQDVAREAQPSRQIMHKWPEAHALHHAANADLPPRQLHARW